jgi:flagellin-like protein
MNIALKKKGLSPVIATVLLVVLALVLAAIIFLWARGFVTEQLEKQGKPTDQVCKDVSFEIDSTPVGGGVEVQIVNRGNIPIYNFDVKFVGAKDSSIKSFNFGVDVGGATDRELIPIVGNPTQLVLYPMILGNVRGKQVSKPVTCLDQGKTVRL